MAKIDAKDFADYVDAKKNDISDEINRILGFNAVTKTSSLTQISNSMRRIPSLEKQSEYINPNHIDIESILDNDSEEFISKWAYLIPDALYKDIIIVPSGCVIKTSDGAYYDNSQGTSNKQIEHIWDLNKDIENENILYKQRYILVINKKNNTFSDINTLMTTTSLAGFGNGSYLELYIINCNNLEYKFDTSFQYRTPTNDFNNSDRLYLEKLKFKNCIMHDTIFTMRNNYLYINSIYFDNCDIQGQFTLKVEFQSGGIKEFSERVNLSEFIIEHNNGNTANVSLRFSNSNPTIFLQTIGHTIITSSDMLVYLKEGLSNPTSYGSGRFLKKLKIIGKTTYSSTSYIAAIHLDLTEYSIDGTASVHASGNNKISLPLELFVSDNFEYNMICDHIQSLNNKRIILQKCKDLSDSTETRILTVGPDAIQAFPEEVEAAQLKGWTIS